MIRTTASPGRFRPRLTLQTLTRGDGLLGSDAALAPKFNTEDLQFLLAPSS